MPAGKTHPRPIRWPSREFLDVLDAIYARQGTNLAARMIEHAMADIERDGTPEQKELAREHLAARAKPGPKPKKSADPALSQLDDLLKAGILTEDQHREAQNRARRS